MKKLIAAAVAAAIVPAAALANPTLYGKIHMDVSHIDNDVDTNVSVNTNSSRVGVKGSEDLGNGMKAVYAIEWGVDMRGTGTLSNRNRWVGVGGGFGTVALGTESTPAKMVGRKTDLFGDRAGDTRAMNPSKVMDIYAPNAIAYFSPNMGGFTTYLAYVTDGSGATADNNDLDAIGANIEYKNGPLYAGLGYTKYSGDIFGGENQTVMRLGASYKMGDAKLVGSYTSVSDVMGVKGNDGKTYSLGLAYGFGANTAKIQYSALNADGTKTDADNITVGIDHKMSKRTSVYAQYSATSNDANANVAAWAKEGNSTGVAAGDDNAAFSVGIVHKF